jgi:hypothetical protein
MLCIDRIDLSTISGFLRAYSMLASPPCTSIAEDLKKQRNVDGPALGANPFRPGLLAIGDDYNGAVC